MRRSVKREHPGNRKVRTGVLSCRDAVYDGPNGNSPLGQNPATHADDFKPGFRLEVGELTRDRYKVGKARRHPQATSLHPTPTGARTIARPVEQPARKGGVPSIEHIDTGGMNGYPAPTYLERNGMGLWTH